MQIKVYCDGGARGNPGPAAIGVIAYDETGKPLFKISQKIGTATNNQAEYRAVIAALEKVLMISDPATPRLRGTSKPYAICDLQSAISDKRYAIALFLDSELLVKQLNQEYKVKNPVLKELFWQIRDLVLKLGGKVSFCFVGREKNRQADRLVNKALDQK